MDGRNEVGFGQHLTDLWERFYYHNAGLAGGGGSSYIDSVIRRDRNAAAVVGGEGAETLEEALYYMQNWRGDVVSLVRSNGWWAEQVRYSAYGRPFCMPIGDFNGSGSTTVMDYTSDFLTAWYASNIKADHNFSGSISVQDIFDFLADWSPHTGSAGGRDALTGVDGGGALHWDNRKGYAGYEHDPVLADMQLARHRWYRADLGTWMRRDPLGYVDGTSLYELVKGMPIISLDPTGLFVEAKASCCDRWARQGNNRQDRQKAQAVTFCCDGRPITCIFRDNIETQNPNSKEFQDIYESCTKRHESQHHIDQDPAYDCTKRNIPGLEYKDGVREWVPKLWKDQRLPDPTAIMNCSECKAWQQTMICLQEGLDKCPPGTGRIRNGIKEKSCSDYVKEKLETAQMMIDAYCGACASGKTPPTPRFTWPTRTPTDDLPAIPALRCTPGDPHGS